MPSAGWCVVDRNTVPAPLGDVRLTFAGTIEIPGPRRVRPSAAQPRDRLLRPGADRRDAGAARDVQAGRAAARRAGLGGRHARRRQGAVALGDRRLGRSGGVPAVAHAAVPRVQSRDDRAGQRPERLRRRAGEQERRGGRELGELRVRSGPRDRAGEPRHSRRADRSRCCRWCATAARLHSLEAELQPVPLAECAQARPAGPLGQRAWSSTARSVGRC